MEVINHLLIRFERTFFPIIKLFRKIFRKPPKSKPLPPGSTPFHNVKHFFVLMLENRSFDHMLGFSGIQNIEGLTGTEFNLSKASDSTSKKNVVTSDAEPIIHPDPPHEFDNVKVQLLGSADAHYAKDASNITNSGFVESYLNCPGHTPADPGFIMKCHSPQTIPVLTELARQFAVCDHWFSSLPGPTWPNRFFVHGATSGGLDDSPSSLKTVSSYVGNPFKFKNGTIYDAISKAGYKWRVYHGDFLPQVLAFDGMERHFFDPEKYRAFDGFAADLQSEESFPEYIFIEPNYGNSLDSDTEQDFRGGNSQHPVGDIGDGEKLIRDVYLAIRNSKFWENSCLIITYDEHGGFYDHLKPDPATQPGDQTRYNSKGFDFSIYGVRVPAVIVSPYIAATVDKNIHDHTSILKTVEMRLGIKPLSARDASGSTSQSFENLFRLSEARKDVETLPNPVFDTNHRISMELTLTKQVKPLDINTRNFLHLAARMEKESSPEQAEDIDARVAAIEAKNDQTLAKKFIEEIQSNLKTKRNGTR